MKFHIDLPYDATRACVVLHYLSTHSLTLPLTHSPTYPLTHLPTYPLTHSLTQVIIEEFSSKSSADIGAPLEFHRRTHNLFEKTGNFHVYMHSAVYKPIEFLNISDRLCSIPRLCDWLTGWLSDWLSYWLTDWLTNWLTDQYCNNWLTEQYYWMTGRYFISYSYIPNPSPNPNPIPGPSLSPSPSPSPTLNDWLYIILPIPQHICPRVYSNPCNPYPS